MVQFQQSYLSKCRFKHNLPNIQEESVFWVWLWASHCDPYANGVWKKK